MTTRWQCDDVDHDAPAVHDGDYGEMIKVMDNDNDKIMDSDEIMDNDKTGTEAV